jgi:ribosomal protein S18 acetylase RimI-like enzyme
MYDEDTAELKRLYVKPEYRKCGIARELLSSAENGAVKRGANEMILKTYPPLWQAHDFYMHFGYRPIPNYSPHKRDLAAICMKKCLDTEVATPPKRSLANHRRGSIECLKDYSLRLVRFRQNSNGIYQLIGILNPNVLPLPALLSKIS